MSKGIPRGSSHHLQYLQLAKDVVDKEISSEFCLDDNLQAVLDALPFALLLVDEDHHIVLVNRVVTQMVGKHSCDLLGAFCPNAIHGTDAPVDYCPLEKCLVTGEPTELRVYLPENDVWVETGAYPTHYVSEAGKRVYIHTVRDVTESQRSAAEVDRQSRTRVVLYDLLHLVMSGDSLEQVLLGTLDRLFDVPWLGLEKKGAIFVRRDDGSFPMVAQRNLDARLLELCATIEPGRCLCGRALAQGGVVFAGCVDDRHDVQYPGMKPHGHYCVAIGPREDVQGVLNLYVAAQHAHDEDDEAFLRSVSDLLATFITRHRARLGQQRALDELEQSLAGTVRAIGSMLAARDPYTSGHQERVARVADLIAGHLGWSEERRRPLGLAARLHDIGKIVVPVEVLAKPGRLSAPEFAMIKAHSEVGHAILSDIVFPWPIADIVRQHHEKLDGSGYPDGLRGDELLPESRVLAVADVLEAVASSRPYRPALGLQKALDILSEGRAQLFAAEAVDAALTLAANHQLDFIEES